MNNGVVMAESSSGGAVKLRKQGNADGRERSAAGRCAHIVIRMDEFDVIRENRPNG